MITVLPAICDTFGLAFAYVVAIAYARRVCSHYNGSVGYTNDGVRLSRHQRREPHSALISSPSSQKQHRKGQGCCGLGVGADVPIVGKIQRNAPARAVY